MKTTEEEHRRLVKKRSILGIGLCVLACTLPFVGAVGGVGILTTVALYSEKIAMAFLIISITSFAIWQYKKKQVLPACSIDCDCKTENAASKIIAD